MYSLGLTPTWSYKQVRDLRTFMEETPLSDDRKTLAKQRAQSLLNGQWVPHDAYSDCVTQIFYHQMRRR